MGKYECGCCGYIYDPNDGDIDGNVDPGTEFDDVPDDWTCPECGCGKEEFESI